MSFSKIVETKDGQKKTVVAGSQEDLDEAVKLAESTNVENKIDINMPVNEGADLVVINEDGSQELSSSIPETALNFDPEVEQKFNKNVTGGGGNFNNKGAKAAAKANAEEAAK